MSILGALELVDTQMDKISRMITRASVDDPELGAGLASVSMPSTQAAIDYSAVVVGELDAHLRDLARRNSL